MSLQEIIVESGDPKKSDIRLRFILEKALKDGIIDTADTQSLSSEEYYDLWRDTLALYGSNVFPVFNDFFQREVDL